MTHDWLLVETLGAEPAVVAQGQHTKNLVPISAFLRRNPNLMAIQTAINETVQAGKALIGTRFLVCCPCATTAGSAPSVSTRSQSCVMTAS